VLVRGARGVERALVGHEAGELEHLPGDKSALVAAVSFLDDVAHLAHRELDILELDAGLEFHGVEQHLGAERQRDRFEHQLAP